MLSGERSAKMESCRQKFFFYAEKYARGIAAGERERGEGRETYAEKGRHCAQKMEGTSTWELRRSSGCGFVMTYGCEAHGQRSDQKGSGKSPANFWNVPSEILVRAF